MNINLLSTFQSPPSSFILHPSSFLYCLLSAACCVLPETVPVEGEPFAAELAGIDSQWQLTFRSGEQRRALPAAELAHWGSCVEIRQGPVLVLADGGVLVADVFQADKEHLTADSGLFGLVELPLELLAGVVFQLPADRHAQDLLLNRVASATGESDQAVLQNGDEVAGRLEAIRDDVIRLETVVGPVDVEIHRTQALVFNPALTRPPKRQALHAVAGFRDGSRLIGDRLALDEQSLEIDVAGSLRWTTAPKEIVWLQPLGGRVTYLSDLEASGYRHVPFLDLQWPYRTDRNVAGGMLRSGGRLYLKGLGMHSAARLTYLLAEPYRRFQAELGIDDATSGRGSVRFRVFVDGNQKYASEPIRGGTPPVPVSVELAGAKRLDLVVDFVDHADQQDHANWLDARLVGPAVPAVSEGER
ncbi:MAG: hypothetical protein A2V98_10870 [Planctomycetes bacterium RBG_16_64_12]|nr:MAG: hypothetical protein A2V98_10870 [Planctomycetes bacterium RBG_16_64_12]